jgi:hypothetical protein
MSEQAMNVIPEEATATAKVRRNRDGAAGV